ncbi:hypothetical protein M3Y94_00433100 [Aphelenchoides besseyi]|nr:hypothetical protein M3Y94_00433100 [Aphelenchoides besseyi]
MSGEQKLVEPKLEVVGQIQPLWYYPLSKLIQLSPSRSVGYSYEAESQMLQRASAFVRVLAERLNELRQTERVSNLCITVALIRLRRFFLIHNFVDFDPCDVGAAALFLSSKSEECPTRLEMIILVSYRLRVELECPPNEWETTSILTKAQCKVFCDYMVWNENMMLQTVGFELEITVPHTSVILLCERYKKPKKFSETVYWMTTDSHHHTDWCVRYRPKTVACIVFYVGSIWAHEPLPKSTNNISWYEDFYDPADDPLDERILADLAIEYTKVLNTSKQNGILALETTTSILNITRVEGR